MDAALASLGSVVAVTKFLVPDQRPGLVPRAPLVEVLAAARPARLVLVTGPAGAGKTTLVVQWSKAAVEDRTFAWLWLDPQDADPVRFWTSVVAALRTVHPGFGARALEALRAGRAAIEQAVVPLLVNEAVTMPEPIVLVLDDLHVVDDAADVQRSLGLFVDLLPPAVQVAVTTRTEPALPTARLRARGQLAEIRAPDLRFTDADAADLLRRGFGVELDARAVARLQERTEGWAAGLQLAGVSLRRRGLDFDRFMQAFADAPDDVLDYLGQEVLDGQPPRLRAFLTRTSVLDRLTAELCDAVCASDDGAESLAQLGRRNLLAVPLDPAGRWWRYHQLFADLLRRRLERDASQEEIAALHRRAAVWHRDHGTAEDAVRHALASGDAALATALVASHWEDTFNRGELTIVSGWLAGLPHGALEREPRLWLAQLWTAMDRGRLEEAEQQLAGAAGAAVPAVRAWGLLLSGLHAFKRGDLDAAAEGLDRAEAIAPADDEFWRTVAALLHGLHAVWSDHPRVAQRHFGRAAELAEANGNRLGLAYAVGYLALIAAEAGDGAAAAGHLDRVAELRAQDGAVGEHFVAFAAALAEGRRLELGGGYEAAVAPLQRAVELADRGAGVLERADPRLRLAAVHAACANAAAATSARLAAVELLEPCRGRHRLAGLSTGPAAPPGALRDELSPSELAVLRLLPTELSQREIGGELFLSINTVKTHCRNIYTKLRVGSREQAVGRARELGLL
jgi:LuxR family maltose regulon positive regulatory protein